LILDEADRILDEYFQEQLHEIVKQCSRTRQTLLFSATMTDAVRDLASVSLDKPVRIFVDNNQDVAFNLRQEFVKMPTAKGSSSIVAKFSSRSKKIEWIAAARKMKGIKSTDICNKLPRSDVYVNEHLSPYYKRLLGWYPNSSQPLPSSLPHVYQEESQNLLTRTDAHHHNTRHRVLFDIPRVRLRDRGCATGVQLSATSTVKQLDTSKFGEVYLRARAYYDVQEFLTMTVSNTIWLTCQIRQKYEPYREAIWLRCVPHFHSSTMVFVQTRGSSPCSSCWVCWESSGRITWQHVPASTYGGSQE
ncbi:ATP-dependent RNA helicase DBP3-like, partial [Nilaparvata lugens]|uniref:ATP-dependent RNA helicase DBP3-like n=1 Tax=Nilaparvata lugens TaxID=108931 RepID=UPI00193E4DC2